MPPFKYLVASGILSCTFYFFEACTRTSKRVLFHKKLCIYQINIQPKHLSGHGNRFTQLEQHSPVVQSMDRNSDMSELVYCTGCIVLGISCWVYRAGYRAGYMVVLVVYWRYVVWYRIITMTMIITIITIDGNHDAPLFNIQDIQATAFSLWDSEISYLIRSRMMRLQSRMSPLARYVGFWLSR